MLWSAAAPRLRLDFNLLSTSLIASWPAESRHVRSRTVKQRFLVLAEPQNYRQAEIEADQEPGPRADATLWHRRGGDVV